MHFSGGSLIGFQLCWVTAIYSVYLASPGGGIPKGGAALVPLALAITVVLSFLLFQSPILLEGDKWIPRMMLGNTEGQNQAFIITGCPECK